MTEHKCKKCGSSSDDVPFSIRPSGTSQSYCKSCQNEYSKAHYKLNKHKHNKTRAARWKSMLIILRSIVRDAKNKPCVDCNKVYDYWVMQFDHVKGEKHFNIAAFSTIGCGKERLLAEIAKCEIVCANCHMERTHKRRTIG